MRKKILSVVLVGCLLGLLWLPALADETASSDTEEETGGETDTPGDTDLPDTETEPVTDVVKDATTEEWVYTVDGIPDYSYNGFAENKNGWWYIEDGIVTFDTNSVIKDTTGAIEEGGVWWYVVGSKVQFDFTGLANYKNENGWWYIKDGQVDFTHNGVDKNKNGWWYVTGGKVQFGFTGLANYKNANGWWYIKNGKVDFSYTGVAGNNNGTWYVENGRVNFDYTGTVTYNGTVYNVVGGKIGLTMPSLKAATVDYEGIKVSWSAVSGAGGYRVFRKTENGSWSAIGTTTSTSYVDKNSGSNGTIYYYTVRAYIGDLDTAKQHIYSADYWSGYDASGVSGCSYEIMGTSSVTAAQLIQSLKDTGYVSTVRKTLTDCTLEELAQYYIEEAKAEGVRAEVAWCQSILETNWFTFAGCAVDPSYHNYCGHGATDGGGTPEYYSSSRIGVRAQIQHLKAYASTDALNQTCVDGRFKYVTRGKAKFVEILGQQENPGGYGWATGADYGPHIVRLIRQTNLAGK